MTAASPSATRHRPRLAALLTTALVLAFTPPLGAQSRAEDTRVEIEHLGASAYHVRITDSAGVTNLLASLGAEGALLIDHLGDWRTRIPDTVQARVIRDTMARVHPAPLRFLVNTHAHGDHTGGNEIHGATAVIIAHAGTRAALREPDPFGGTAGRLIAEHGLPTLIFEDSLTVHLNGETIRLVHFGPAHTSGDLVAFFERADVIHMGDLFNGFHSPPVGDLGGLLRTYDRVARRIGDATRIVTGHGGVESRSDLVAYASAIRAGADSVRARMTRGLALEAMLPHGLPPFEGRAWSPRLQSTMLTQIHRALARGEELGAPRS